MTVRLGKIPEHFYYGLSTDTKPAADVGTRFIETDKGNTYICTDGTNWSLYDLREDGAITSRAYFLAIAEGDVAGHALFARLGFAPDAPASEIDVWSANTAYVFPTVAAGMECVSSSANDAAASTGVKTVRIYYLKSDYTEATTDVILTGTSAVATTPTDLFRINDMRVIDFGSGVTTYKAIGNIDVRNVTDHTTVYSRIYAGQTEARSLIYTVPHGKTLYLTSMAVGVTKGSTTGNVALFTLRATYDRQLGSLLTAGKFFMPFAEVNHMDGMVTREFQIPIKFIAHTDIKISCLAAQSSTIATASIRGWQE